MIRKRLNEWIRHPERLDGESLNDLRSLLVQYPYFQTARLLYLKNLFLLGDASFPEELRKGALYVADLGVLFYHMEGERFIVERGQKETETGDSLKEVDRTLDLIDRFLSGLSGQCSVELPLPNEVNVDYASILMRGLEEEKAGQPLLRGQELIDNFIGSSGKSVKKTAEETEKEFQPEVPDDAEEESYFTETLAKIYVRQHRYDKALEIIQKLNLKYPKKNAYFADQIRFLEKLIINAKSK